MSIIFKDVFNVARLEFVTFFKVVQFYLPSIYENKKKQLYFKRRHKLKWQTSFEDVSYLFV